MAKLPLNDLLSEFLNVVLLYFQRRYTRCCSDWIGGVRVVVRSVAEALWRGVFCNPAFLVWGYKMCGNGTWPGVNSAPIGKMYLHTVRGLM